MKLYRYEVEKFGIYRHPLSDYELVLDKMGREFGEIWWGARNALRSPFDVGMHRMSSNMRFFFTEKGKSKHEMFVYLATEFFSALGLEVIEFCDEFNDDECYLLEDEEQAVVMVHCYDKHREAKHGQRRCGTKSEGTGEVPGYVDKLLYQYVCSWASYPKGITGVQNCT